MHHIAIVTQCLTHLVHTILVDSLFAIRLLPFYRRKALLSIMFIILACSSFIPFWFDVFSPFIDLIYLWSIEI
jgi:hypothetical protein